MPRATDLLRFLGKQGLATPRQIAEGLGVSLPNVSRLAGSAGEDVWRFGRARSTRYARTRRVDGRGPRFLIHRVDEAGAVDRWGELVALAAGRHGLILRDGTELVFEGLPPFAVDMAPQGFLGRALASRMGDVGLPARLVDWNDDHRLLALVRRGEDTIGDLILGDESLERYFAHRPEPVAADQFIQRARGVLRGEVGSSAGGEHPKFAALVEGRHVLVKFAAADADATVQRWRDLLIAEAIALETARDAGISAPAVRRRSLEGWQFLEVERFDRVGPRGRRAVLSFGAVDNEYVGVGASWSAVASALHARKLLGAEDLRAVRWLDVFGNLIGNTDRHLGNLSLLGDFRGPYRLAPVYDMLPMAFAPTAAGGVVDRPLALQTPKAETIDVWADAALRAAQFWERLVRTPELSQGFRELAKRSGDEVTALRASVPL